MSTLSLIKIFNDNSNNNLVNSLSQEIEKYMTTREVLSAREIMDFRLSSEFDMLEEYFRNLTSLLKASSGVDDVLYKEIEVFLRLLLLLCVDYDFSFQFGNSGGHQLLKLTQRFQERLPPNVGSLVDEVIACILDNGIQYPMQMSVCHHEMVQKPLIYNFRTKRLIYERDESCPSNHSTETENSICVYVRQVPVGMQGAGQATVGYVMWSSAVILSRWIALNSSLFKGKCILEIGAGNALCGVVAATVASHVTLTDFNEVVLKNIESVISLNTGLHRMTCSERGENNLPCLGSEVTNIEVCRFDWNRLLPTHCIPSDASSTYESRDDAVISKFQDILEPQRMERRKFDIVVASDVVCCDSDAVGVSHSFAHFLLNEQPDDVCSSPAGIVVVASEYHRYGVKNLVKELTSVGLVVHWRYVSNSEFCNEAYEDAMLSGKSNEKGNSTLLNSFCSCGTVQSKSVHTTCGCCSSCREIFHNQTPLADAFGFTAEDDYLTEGLEEAPYYKWMFLIIHGKPDVS